MFFRIALSLLLILLSSCVTKVTPEQPAVRNYQTNQQGQNPYYYQQPGYQRPYYQQYQQQNYQQYNPYGNTAGSRFYSNPYAMPAAPQYYDSDQYYVPPQYYNNGDQPQSNNPFYRESSPF